MLTKPAKAVIHCRAVHFLEHFPAAYTHLFTSDSKSTIYLLRNNTDNTHHYMISLGSSK